MNYNKTYIFGITLVATLGGLLFGYDTAVISGMFSNRFTGKNIAHNGGFTFCIETLRQLL